MDEFQMSAGMAQRKNFHQQVGARFNRSFADERDPLGRDIRDVRIQYLIAAQEE